MRARFFNKVSRGHLAWLLGILLLMPLAQTAAAWHLISHAQTQATEKQDPQAPSVADYCDLCQIAAATTGGLLPTQAVAGIAAATPGDVPHFPCQAAVLQPLWPPYASRAPPSL